MKKKLYEKPSMKVFMLPQRTALLASSEKTPLPGDNWYWE